MRARPGGRIPGMRRAHPLSATVRVKKLHEEALVPRQQTEGSSGFDLHACLPEGNGPVKIAPGEQTLVGTGVAVAIDFGYEGQVRPRSGLAAKHGITITNSPGTIDADYRGELMAAMVNLGAEPLVIEPGTRVAQIVFAPVAAARLVEGAIDAARSGRGDGGFGSTGLVARGADDVTTRGDRST